MSQTALTVVVLVQNNVAVTAGQLTLTPTAMDAANGNSFAATGREVLVFENTDTSAHTVTISSVPDSLGRSDTSLTTYSIPAAVGGASGVAAIQMKFLTGWLQTNGLIYLATSSALVKVSVLQSN
jgi:hypothetical protein